MQARGMVLRSESNKRRRVALARRKEGAGKERSWWEVEGWWKRDSVVSRNENGVEGPGADGTGEVRRSVRTPSGVMVERVEEGSIAEEVNGLRW